MACQTLRLTPWIQVHYPILDEDAFAEGGIAEMTLHCKVCDYSETTKFMLPEAEDPKWLEIMQIGDPFILAERGAFQFSHRLCGIGWAE